MAVEGDLEAVSVVEDLPGNSQIAQAIASELMAALEEEWGWPLQTLTTVHLEEDRDAAP